MRIPLIGISDSGRYPDINAHRAINLMPQVSVSGAKEKFYWVASPGSTLKANIAAVARGMHSWDGYLWYVANNTLYKMSTTGTITSIGSLGASTSTVVFTHTQDQLVMTQEDGYVYVYDKNDSTVSYTQSTASHNFSVTSIGKYSGTTYRAICTEDLYGVGVGATASITGGVWYNQETWGGISIAKTVGDEAHPFTYTLTSSAPHNPVSSQPGASVVISGNSIFDGTKTILSNPTSSTLTFEVDDDYAITDIAHQGGGTYRLTFSVDPIGWFVAGDAIELTDTTNFNGYYASPSLVVGTPNKIDILVGSIYADETSGNAWRAPQDKAGGSALVDTMHTSTWASTTQTITSVNPAGKAFFFTNGNDTDPSENLATTPATAAINVTTTTVGATSAGLLTKTDAFSDYWTVTAIAPSEASSQIYICTVSTYTTLGAGCFVRFYGTNSFDHCYLVLDRISDTSFTFLNYNNTDIAESPSDATVWGWNNGSNWGLVPTHCAYMDGYVVINNSINYAGYVDYDFFVSEVQDARLWLALNTGAAERQPDPMVALVAFQGDLWFIGSLSTETYYNSGTSGQPFTPTRPTAMPWGCAGPYTVAQVGNGLMWLATRDNGQPTVVLTEGYTITPVASGALEYYLAQATQAQLDAATAFSYREEKGDFYCLTFNSRTWVYDETASKMAGQPMWHERKSPSLEYSRWKYYGYLAGEHLVSDSTGARIGKLTRDTSLDYTSALTRVGISGYINDENKGVTHHSVVLDIQHPVSATAGVVELSWSDDGGNTFATPLESQFTGLDSRVEFFGLGFSRNSRVYKIEVSANATVNVIGAYLTGVESRW